MWSNILGLGGSDEKVQEVLGGFGGFGFFVGCFFFFPLAFLKSLFFNKLSFCCPTYFHYSFCAIYVVMFILYTRGRINFT